MANCKIFLFIFVNFIVIHAQLSDKRLCANPDCTELISRAESILSYSSITEGMLSFPAGSKVEIYSKAAGSNLKLWGAKINGKRGYVPVSHVRETKILIQKLDYIEPVEENLLVSNKVSSTSISSVSNSETDKQDKTKLDQALPQDQINPNSVKQPYEFIDGTKIYHNTDELSYSDPVKSEDTNKEQITATTENTVLSSKAEISAANITIPSEKQTNEEYSTETNGNVEPAKVKIEQIVEQGADTKPLTSENNEGASVEDEDVFLDDEYDDEDNLDDNDHEDADDEDYTEKIDNEDESNGWYGNRTESSEFKNENSETVPHVDQSDALSVSPNENVIINTTLQVVTQNETPVNESNVKIENITEITENVDERVTLGTTQSVSSNANVPSENLNETFHEYNTHQNQVPDNLLSSVNENTVPLPVETDEFVSTTEAKVLEDSLSTENKPNENSEAPEILNISKLNSSDSEQHIGDNMNNYTDSTVISETVNDNIVTNTEKMIEESELLQEKDLENTVQDVTTEDVFDTSATEGPTVSSLTALPETFEDVPDDFTTKKIVSDDQLKTEASFVEPEVQETILSEENKVEAGGLFSNLYNSVFGKSGDTLPDNENVNKDVKNIEEKKEETLQPNIKDPYGFMWNLHSQEKPAEKYLPSTKEPVSSAGIIQSDMQTCDANQDPSTCKLKNDETETHSYMKDINVFASLELPENTYSTLSYMTVTGTTILIFMFGYYYIEKKRKDGTLIANINNLEQKLLVSTKECLLLQDDLKITKERLASIEDSSFGSNEMVVSLKHELEESKHMRSELEEQISNLERELENATEAGMELNRMLREILSTQSGNDHLVQNIDHLQRQLSEQQVTINSMNATLNDKKTENELLQTKLLVTSEKCEQLQLELDKMVVHLLTVQEEKSKSESDLEEQLKLLKQEYESRLKNTTDDLLALKEDNKALRNLLDNTKRNFDLKSSEYNLLKESMAEIQSMQSNQESLKALIDVSKVKAEVQQLRAEKHGLTEKLQTERETKLVYEKEVEVAMQEVKILKDKFEEAEREKVEAQTRLEVLSTYFKDREAQLQKEATENETIWVQKQGEATSTIERIKWIQEELQNYKSQNELLKKEILDQEVSLKSHISMLEKKAHDNWLQSRQAERRLEEARQEASQLRNRLTVVEKNLSNTSQGTDETKIQNRILSPLDANGDLSVSPVHMGNVDASASPPLLYPHRDHMTTSPPLPGLPPFMPPPPGVVPFMPSPLPGMPPYMPPPPALFPGDRRPPPLGRMSSPPLHGRYSPDSPYERDDSPPAHGSPTYTDTDYRRRSPPPRNYSPYGGKGQWPDDDRDYRPRVKPRVHKGAGLSSGSGNSNDSLDNSGRHSGRV